MRPLRRSHSTLTLVLALAVAGPARALLAEEPAAAEPPVSAEPETPVVPEEPPAPSERWRPPAPDPKSFDWLRLNSGEWLKGEIDRMRDETLYFDSEELDNLKVDWEDIAAGAGRAGRRRRPIRSWLRLRHRQ